jgi:hypothetical protein
MRRFSADSVSHLPSRSCFIHRLQSTEERYIRANGAGSSRLGSIVWPLGRETLSFVQL